MRTFIFAIVLILSTLHSPLSIRCQGFVWEYSPRAPRTMPTLFAGIEVGSGYLQHSTDVTYTQAFIPCCEFESGGGIPMRVVVMGEKWISAQTALHAGAGISFSSSTFTAAGDTLPWRDTQVITEYDYNASLTYATLEAGIRQRLFASYLSIGLSLRGQILLSESERLVERVVSPDEFNFSGNPPSKEMEISSLLQTKFSSFVFEPAISIQYDVALGVGYYIAPSLTFSMPVTSVSSDATWRYLSTGFGIRLLRGL